MNLPFRGQSLVLLLLELFTPRFVLAGVLIATAFPGGVPYNLWQSVPFCHSYNTSPGKCFRVFLSALGGIHPSGEMGVFGLVGTPVEVHRQPT